MDHAKEAKKLRDRAEECRELAEIMKGQEVRDSYLVLAKSYEALAKTEEAMIGLPHDTVKQGRLSRRPVSIQLKLNG